MEMKYEGLLLIVADLKAAKDFYESVLGQTTRFYYEGEMVTFESGISLAPESAYKSWMTDEAARGLSVRRQSNNFQLYFEVEDIEDCYATLKENPELNWLHAPIEVDYGARTMRLYDLDGHIIEISEAIALVAKRLADEGMTTAEIAEKFGDPVETVEALIEESK